jgi:aerobic-type carbon monoxide dehydrogenase small subunit (CoxS/CutS family)
MELLVNGAKRTVNVDPGRSLLSVLRDKLDLTGSKYGCGEGKCGACTVLVDGEAVRSCTARVGLIAGRAITTIEGLADPDGSLHPVQKAFLDHGAMQCGYCTPGMIVAAAALLAKNASPGPTEIVEAMNGNMCRCGVYTRIVAAIRSAGASLAKGGDR